MRLVIFGLSISSSWGNGHATIWRGLCSALARRGHRVVFFERDVPYYASHRDLNGVPGGELVLYSDWKDALSAARRHVADADVAIVTSYCPDGIAATELVLDSAAPVKAFYDLDTPVTLEALNAGRTLSYIGRRGLADFDVVLSYTGGEVLQALQTRLGARRVQPLYGSVDPDVHHPVPPRDEYRCDLSYLGTYSQDRQAILEKLFIETARQMPELRFLLGGAMYPAEFPWTDNLYFIRHVPPPQHGAFYCSSRATLSVTRGPMAAMGWCPSGRLFEAAACGTPVVSDEWKGLDEFFEPGREIIIARETADVREVVSMSAEQLARIGKAARERALACHTAAHRAAELESILERAASAQQAASLPGRA